MSATPHQPDLDIEQPAALRDYLVRAGYISRDEVVESTTLVGGVSNRTVLVTRAATGEQWVLKQALAKLRVAVDWFSDPARVHREAQGLRWISRVAPGATPEVVFEDVHRHILAMRAVPQPHENWKVLLLAGNVDGDHVRQFATLLATIHGRSHAMREDAARDFADRSFFESLRLEPYYGYTAEQVPDARDFLYTLVDATRATRQAIVHGDYSPKNVLVHPWPADGARPARLVLLDHEVIHFGDPSFDLGFAMTHLLSKAHHVIERRDAFAAATKQFWRDYHHGLPAVDAAVLLDGLEARAVRQTLGCLLARVAGRSTLEYLTPHERDAQRAAVVTLMRYPPSTVNELVDSFLLALPNHADD